MKRKSELSYHMSSLVSFGILLLLLYTILMGRAAGHLGDIWDAFVAFRYYLEVESDRAPRRHF